MRTALSATKDLHRASSHCVNPSQKTRIATLRRIENPAQREAAIE